MAAVFQLLDITRSSDTVGGAYEDVVFPSLSLGEDVRDNFQFSFSRQDPSDDSSITLTEAGKALQLAATSSRGGGRPASSNSGKPNPSPSSIVIGRHSRLPPEHRLYHNNTSRFHAVLTLMTGYDAQELLQEDLAQHLKKAASAGGSGGAKKGKTGRGGGKQSKNSSATEAKGGGAATTTGSGQLFEQNRLLKHWEKPPKDQLVAMQVILVEVLGLNGLRVNGELFPHGSRVVVTLGDTISFLEDDPTIKDDDEESLSSPPDRRGGRKTTTLSKNVGRQDQDDADDQMMSPYFRNAVNVKRQLEGDDDETRNSSRFLTPPKPAASRLSAHKDAGGSSVVKLLRTPGRDFPVAGSNATLAVVGASDGKMLISKHALPLDVAQVLQSQRLPTFQFSRRSPSPELTTGLSKAPPPPVVNLALPSTKPQPQPAGGTKASKIASVPSTARGKRGREAEEEESSEEGEETLGSFVAGKKQPGTKKSEDKTNNKKKAAPLPKTAGPSKMAKSSPPAPKPKPKPKTKPSKRK